MGEKKCQTDFKLKDKVDLSFEKLPRLEHDAREFEEQSAFAASVDEAQKKIVDNVKIRKDEIERFIKSLQIQMRGGR